MKFTRYKGLQHRATENRSRRRARIKKEASTEIAPLSQKSARSHSFRRSRITDTMLTGARPAPQHPRGIQRFNQPGPSAGSGTAAAEDPKIQRAGLGLFLLLLVELTLLLGGGVLVLLVLRNKVVHVGLSLGELHLVHTLAGIPVKEGLAAEHGGELLRHALEELLDGGRVANNGGSHLEALGGDVGHGRLDVVAH